jgi:hypothetical protein
MHSHFSTFLSKVFLVYSKISFISFAFIVKLNDVVNEIFINLLSLRFSIVSEMIFLFGTKIVLHFLLNNRVPFSVISSTFHSKSFTLI